jgi:hypothetical protein
MTEDELKNKGLNFEVDKPNEHMITIKTSEILDNIKDTEDSILKEVVGCERCNKGYRIVEMELSYARKMKLPLFRICPFCRINEKFSLWVENMHLYKRTCGKCSIEFNTHYTEKRAPIVYCKKCYQQEVY